MTRSAVHGILKEIFSAAATRWQDEGCGLEQANKLKAASAVLPVQGVRQRLEAVPAMVQDRAGQAR